MKNRNVYLWKISENYPENCIGEYRKDNVQDRFDFKKGIRIDGEIATPTIEFSDVKKEQIEPFACLASNMMVPIVNAKIVKILEEMVPDQVQTFDVILKAKDCILKNYKILNVTQECNCIDENETEYLYLAGSEHILGYKKFKYKTGCMDKLQIARDKDFHGHLLVSYQIRCELKKIDNLGIHFEKAN